MLYLKLFRYRNLLMIILIQYLIRYCIILPLLEANGLTPLNNDLFFFFLVFSCVLITAAGYAINDYFDLRIDRINKPNKIILGRKISRRRAIFFHSFFNILGILLAAFVAIKLQMLRLIIIQIVATTLLWFYATKYKRQFLIGNIIVALLTAFVILTVWIFEFYPRQLVLNEPIDYSYTKIIVYLYTAFAFITTILREIIKDIQDIEGDQRVGCKTLPIQWGINKAKSFVIVLILFTIISITYIQYLFWVHHLILLLIYSLIFIQLPFVFVIFKIIKANEKKHYVFLNVFTKLIMLMGILSMLLLLCQ